MLENAYGEIQALSFVPLILHSNSTELLVWGFFPLFPL